MIPCLAALVLAEADARPPATAATGSAIQPTPLLNEESLIRGLRAAGLPHEDVLVEACVRMPRSWEILLRDPSAPDCSWAVPVAGFDGDGLSATALFGASRRVCGEDRAAHVHALADDHRRRLDALMAARAPTAEVLANALCVAPIVAFDARSRADLQRALAHQLPEVAPERTAFGDMVLLADGGLAVITAPGTALVFNGIGAEVPVGSRSLRAMGPILRRHPAFVGHWPAPTME